MQICFEHPRKTDRLFPGRLCLGRISLISLIIALVFYLYVIREQDQLSLVWTKQKESLLDQVPRPNTTPHLYFESFHELQNYLGIPFYPNLTANPINKTELYEKLKIKEHEINYTATYRLDSDIRTSYGCYRPFVPAKPWIKNPVQTSERNYAHGKTKLGVGLVSNCLSASPRLKYINELKKFVPIDIFGHCGSVVCDKPRPVCLYEYGKTYKFYLAFENSLCQDYVTEKFFTNALQYDLVPVVMGASIDEYKQIAPPNSFIHVDQFESPQHLADYLNFLNRNDTAYNAYFQWKKLGFVSDETFHPQCHMCLLAHSVKYLKPKWYEDAVKWWNSGCRNRHLRWSPSP